MDAALRLALALPTFAIGIVALYAGHVGPAVMASWRSTKPPSPRSVAIQLCAASSAICASWASVVLPWRLNAGWFALGFGCLAAFILGALAASAWRNALAAPEREPGPTPDEDVVFSAATACVGVACLYGAVSILALGWLR